MTSRRRIPSRRRASARRSGRYLWHIDGFDETSLAQNAQAATRLLTTLGASVVAGSIVERIVGKLWWRTTADDATVGVAHAFYIANEDQRSAGAFPDLDDDDAQYLWHDTSVSREGLLTDTGEKYKALNFDFKPRRRLRGDQTRLMHIVENISATATGINALLRLRTLLRVP